MAKGLGIKSYFFDMNDIYQTYIQPKRYLNTQEKIEPVFIEFSTYRWREHCGQILMMI